MSDVRIECDPSGVQIVINSTALEEAIPNLDPSTLRVGQGPWLSECIPDEAEQASAAKDFNTFKFGYGDCHPTITEVSKLSFTGLIDCCYRDLIVQRRPCRGQVELFCRRVKINYMAGLVLQILPSFSVGQYSLLNITTYSLAKPAFQICFECRK